VLINVISQITTSSARPIPSPPEYQERRERISRRPFATLTARATVGGECNTAAPEESNRVSEKEPQNETELWKNASGDPVRAMWCAATWKSGASAPRKILKI
jgi:hypothetical protein